MRTGTRLLLVAALLVGGTAACSDDDDGGDDTPAGAEVGDAVTTDAAGDEGADDGAAGTGTTGAGTANDAVIQEYCDAVDAYSAALQESLDDPDDEAKQAAVRDLSTRVGDASTAVADKVPDFTPEQTNQFEACSDEFAEAGG